MVNTNSKIAYRAIHNLGKLQQMVYDYIKQREAHGDLPSRQDIADGIGKPVSSVCGRVNELLHYGHIKECGKRMGRFGTPVDMLCTSNPDDKKLGEAIGWM